MVKRRFSGGKKKIAAVLAALFFIITSGETLYAASRLKGKEAERFLKSRYAAIVSGAYSFAMITPDEGRGEKYSCIIINPSGGQIKARMRADGSILVRLYPDKAGNERVLREDTWKTIESINRDERFGGHVLLMRTKEPAAICFLSPQAEYNYHIRGAIVSLEIYPKSRRILDRGLPRAGGTPGMPGYQMTHK